MQNADFYERRELKNRALLPPSSHKTPLFLSLFFHYIKHMKKINKTDKQIFKTYYDSPIGQLLLTSDGKALTGLWIEGQKYFASTIKEEPIQKDELEIFVKTKDWLDRYFAGQKPLPQELPLAPEGSDFRKAVWKILCNIPYGEVMTYGRIAKIIAEQKGLSSMSAQAVGNAVGHNPVSIIIPCHRVIGTNGSLTGYAGGIEKKKKLLQLEGAKITLP